MKPLTNLLSSLTAAAALLALIAPASTANAEASIGINVLFKNAITQQNLNDLAVTARC